MINSLFNICVAFLEWLGSVTKLTYREISVVFNLWIQGGVLVISALLPFIIAVVQYLQNTGSLTYLVLSGVLLTAYSTLFCWIIRHYGTCKNYAFDFCVMDLYRLAKLCHTTYYIINIIIFVIGWLLAFGLNVFITWELLL